MEAIDEYFNIVISRKANYIKNYVYDGDAPTDDDDLYYRIDGDLDLVFRYLNISSRKFGYRYWKDAIFLYISSEKLQVSICKDIYPVIAKKYSKSSSSIERAMRLCFEDALYFSSKNDDNFIYKYLKNVLIYPHNGEIMARIAELIMSADFQKRKLNYHKSFNS